MLNASPIQDILHVPVLSDTADYYEELKKLAAIEESEGGESSLSISDAVSSTSAAESAQNKRNKSRSKVVNGRIPIGSFRNRATVGINFLGNNMETYFIPFQERHARLALQGEPLSAEQTERVLNILKGYRDDTPPRPLTDVFTFTSGGKAAHDRFYRLKPDPVEEEEKEREKKVKKEKKQERKGIKKEEKEEEKEGKPKKGKDKDEGAPNCFRSAKVDQWFSKPPTLFYKTQSEMCKEYAKLPLVESIHALHDNDMDSERIAFMFLRDERILQDMFEEACHYFDSHHSLDSQAYFTGAFIHCHTLRQMCKGCLRISAIESFQATSDPSATEGILVKLKHMFIKKYKHVREFKLHGFSTVVSSDLLYDGGMRKDGRASAAYSKQIAEGHLENFHVHQYSYSTDQIEKVFAAETSERMDPFKTYLFGPESGAKIEKRASRSSHKLKATKEAAVSASDDVMMSDEASRSPPKKSPSRKRPRSGESSPLSLSSLSAAAASSAAASEASAPPASPFSWSQFMSSSPSRPPMRLRAQFLSSLEDLAEGSSHSSSPASHLRPPLSLASTLRGHSLGTPQSLPSELFPPSSLGSLPSPWSSPHPSPLWRAPGSGLRNLRPAQASNLTPAFMGFAMGSPERGTSSPSASMRLSQTARALNARFRTPLFSSAAASSSASTAVDPALEQALLRAASSSGINSHQQPNLMIPLMSRQASSSGSKRKTPQQAPESPPPVERGGRSSRLTPQGTPKSHASSAESSPKSGAGSASKRHKGELPKKK